MFPPLLIGAAVSGVATVGSLLQHYRQQLGPMTLAEVRALESLAPTPIAMAREGMVKLVGTLGCETPSRSLYGNVPVAVREVYYSTIEGRGVRARKVLVRVERTQHPFFVEDETGRVGFDPAHARIDFECEGSDDESMVEEQRLRVGERVAVIGVVERSVTVTQHPWRQASVQGDQGLRFVSPPVITWRTEPEVFPRLIPPMGGVALSAGTLGMAVLGALLRL